MAQKKKKEKMIIDQLKPHYELEMEMFPPELFEQGNLFEMMTDIFKEERVDCVFCLTSGASLPIEGTLEHAGIKRVHVRHEQAAGFAADAYGRLTRRPGVVITGDGTGLNFVSAGIAQAYAAQSPVVHLITCMSSSGAYDTFPMFGRVIPEQMLSPFTKWTRRLDDANYFLFELKRAFRDCVSSPPGPVSLGISALASITQRLDMKVNLTMGYKPGFYPPRQVRTQADPALVEEAMKWLMGAEKPTIMAGEGIHQDDAVEELNELVALIGIPCQARRIARGAISEDNPLNCGGRARGKMLRASDRCLILGLRVTFLENYGNPPFWNHNGRFCQVQTCHENFNLAMPTELELVGNMKMVLRQMIDCLKGMGIKGPPEKWNQWRQFVADAKADYEVRAAARTKDMEGELPLHPDILGRQISEFLREELHDDYIVIFDGLTASGYTTDWIKAVRSGQILDAAETIGLGHSMGMSVGAAMATNRSVPIVSFVGDGSIGIGGMDIETAARWDVPAMYILFNNSWVASDWYSKFGANWFTATGDPLKDSSACLPKIRYDEMFKAFGCHGELVENDKQIKPALKRAMDYIRTKSKPAVVNCLTDPDILHEAWATLGMGPIFTFIPWDEVPEKGRRELIEYRMVPPQFFPYLDPSWQAGLMQAR